jgi:acyl-CoA dehydrogenase
MTGRRAGWWASRTRGHGRDVHDDEQRPAGRGGAGRRRGRGRDQQALAYAQGRVQGRARAGTGTIVDHADVRRMLATMRPRSLRRAPSRWPARWRSTWRAPRARPTGRRGRRFLTPIAKAYGTDTGIEVASQGVQVHGGMGFIEETGAAQYLRDVRVTPIYEGTNGIQAMDLVGRKMADGGEAAFRLIDEVQAGAEAAARGAARPRRRCLGGGRDAARGDRGAAGAGRCEDRNAGSVAYLRAFARCWGRITICARRWPTAGPRAALARVYDPAALPEHAGLLAAARDGGALRGTLRAFGRRSGGLRDGAALQGPAV